MQEARNTAADHQYSLTGCQAREALGPNDASQRLDERTFVERDLVGKPKGSQLNVDFRNANVLSESTGIKMSRSQQIADRLMAGDAIPALPAGNVMGCKDPIARVKIFDPLSCLDDFSRDFVTQNQWGLLDAVPFH